VEQTLSDVLAYLLPDLFRPLRDGDSPVDDGSEMRKDREVMVHGIVVPPEVSIVELYRHFAYADGFVYVSIIERSPSPSQ
jgi:hypothetical protein